MMMNNVVFLEIPDRPDLLRYTFTSHGTGGHLELGFIFPVLIKELRNSKVKQFCGDVLIHHSKA